MDEPMCNSADFSVAAAREYGREDFAAAALDLGQQLLARLDRMAVALEMLAAAGDHNANHVAPAPGDIVGTPYLAQKLGCTTTWAGEMARTGQIPKNCIVPGSGNGKPWKFRREQIEDWINER